MKALRVSRYRTKHRELGLCIYCGDPAVGRKFCAFHLEKTRLRRQARRAAVAMALLLSGCGGTVGSTSDAGPCIPVDSVDCEPGHALACPPFTAAECEDDAGRWICGTPEPPGPECRGTPHQFGVWCCP